MRAVLRVQHYWCLQQKRIVAKVDELMKLCDKLESALTQADCDAERLMDSVVHHLCNQEAIP